MEFRHTDRRAKRVVDILRALARKPSMTFTGTVYYLVLNGKLGPLPTIYAFAMFPDACKCQIELQGLSSRLGGVTFSELCSISAIARILRPKTVFEIGTFDGRTTLNLALNTPEDSCIYTLDLPIDQPESDWPTVNSRSIAGYFKDHVLAHKITQLYGDSLEFDFSPYYHKIDLVFIDANHDYEYVKSDTKNALRMLSDSGTIIWHDYPNSLGVTECLSELKQELSIYHFWETTLACYTKSSLACIPNDPRRKVR